MKILLAFLMIIPLVLTACAPVFDPATGETGKVVFAQSNLERDPNPQPKPGALEGLAIGNTQFAFDFYEQIKDKHDNLIFSPFSISLALSMALEGAAGDTRTEMLQALSHEEFQDSLALAFNALLQAIEASQADLEQDTKGDKFQLNIANSTWGQAGFEINPAFLDALALNYGAGMYTVDYANDAEGARQAINDWVNDETNGKIPDLIPQGAIDALTRLVLANAIYFKGSWLYEFEESATQKAPFTLLDSSKIDVDMMQLSGERLQYAEIGNYQLVRLPYLSTDFSMVLMVPGEGEFKAVESSLTADEFRAALQQMSSERVNLQMPKFDFESSIEANDPLKALGIQKAFDSEAADFSNITDPTSLYISDVLHKATITVDEKGTEAAAATAVIMGLTSMPMGDPIQLTIDRPFMFAIEHQPTGTMLFMGRVVQP